MHTVQLYIWYSITFRIRIQIVSPKSGGSFINKRYVYLIKVWIQHGMGRGCAKGAARIQGGIRIDICKDQFGREKKRKREREKDAAPGVNTQ